MKKLSFLLMAMVMMTVATTSCQKDVDDDEFLAEAEAFMDDADGKTFFNPSNNTLYWKKGDNVQVYLPNLVNKEYRNTLTDDSYRKTVTLKPVTNPALDNNQMQYAFYPTFYVTPKTNSGNPVLNNNDPVFIVDLPAQQVLDNDVNPLNRLHLTRFARAARKDAGIKKFDFLNLCGILKLTIKGDVPIEEIAFTADEFSNGAHEVTWVLNTSTNKYEPFLTPAAGLNFENKTTRLQFHEPVNVTNGQDFFIALPQPQQTTGEAYPYYHNVTITVTNSNYETHTITYQKLRIRRNLITSINRTGDATNHPEINNDDYLRTNGIFTVAQTAPGQPSKKVYIAPGNLQYRSTNWQFANQQYEVLHNESYTPDVYGTEGHEWDLFGWSTANSEYGRSAFGYSWTGYNNWGEVPSETPFKDYGSALGNPDWYTLSIDGWRVLMTERNTSFTVGSTQNVRFAPAGIIDREGPETVWENGVEIQAKHYINGFLLFPDDFSANDWPTNVPTLAGKVVNNPPSFYPNMHNTNNCLTLTKEQFKQLEAKGVIFLPAAGYSEYGQSSVSNFSEYSTSFYYHTSTVAYTTNERGLGNVPWLGENGVSNVNWISNNNNQQFYAENGSMNMYNMQGQSANRRCAVRLVREVPASVWRNQ